MFKNYYVTPKVAQELSSIRFDEPCLGCYFPEDEDNDQNFIPDETRIGDNKSWYSFIHSKNIKRDSTTGKRKGDLAPLWDQAFDWLEREHKVKIELFISPATGKYKYGIRFFNTENKLWEREFNPISFFTKIERNEHAILHTIRILKETNKLTINPCLFY